jgi:holo-[acyl-carrier protein] synthase
MRIVGIGVDVVDVDRVRALLRRRASFRDRVFTPEEVSYCESKAVPAERYAARWAAREACIKALGGVRGFRYQDISVARLQSGDPQLVLEGTAKLRAEDRGVSRVLISFANERGLATAFCLAVED